MDKSIAAYTDVFITVDTIVITNAYAIVYAMVNDKTHYMANDKPYHIVNDKLHHMLYVEGIAASRLLFALLTCRWDSLGNKLEVSLQLLHNCN